MIVQEALFEVTARILQISLCSELHHERHFYLLLSFLNILTLTHFSTIFSVVFTLQLPQMPLFLIHIFRLPHLRGREVLVRQFSYSVQFVNVD